MSAAKGLHIATTGRPVTVETVHGSRYYGHDLAIHANRRGIESVSLTVANGRATVPWHAVNLIHAHTDEAES